MLYKFKSRSTADVIMLEPNGRQILQIIGKDPDEQHGIVTVAQIPGAIKALEEAVAAEERSRKEADANPDVSEEDKDSPKAGSGVQLYQRAAPLIDMLRRSAAEGNDVTW